MASFSQVARGLAAGVATFAAVAVTNIADAQQSPAEAASKTTLSGVQGNNVCQPGTDKLCIKTDPAGVHFVKKKINGEYVAVGICSTKTVTVNGQIGCTGAYSTRPEDIAAGLKGIPFKGPTGAN